MFHHFSRYFPRRSRYRSFFSECSAWIAEWFNFHVLRIPILIYDARRRESGPFAMRDEIFRENNIFRVRRNQYHRGSGQPCVISSRSEIDERKKFHQENPGEKAIARNNLR